MARNTNKDHAIKLHQFVTLIGLDREPYIESGRKFDKVFVEGKVRYFVARQTLPGVESGDILGAKSVLAPNFKWYFGTLDNIDKWDWSDFHGKPVTDDSVMAVKSYGRYIQYLKKT
jgi:hypothetical protein